MDAIVWRIFKRHFPALLRLSYRSTLSISIVNFFYQHHSWSLLPVLAAQAASSSLSLLSSFLAQHSCARGLAPAASGGGWGLKAHHPFLGDVEGLLGLLRAPRLEDDSPYPAVERVYGRAVQSPWPCGKGSASSLGRGQVDRQGASGNTGAGADAGHLGVEGRTIGRCMVGRSPQGLLGPAWFV